MFHISTKCILAEKYKMLTNTQLLPTGRECSVQPNHQFNFPSNMKRIIDHRERIITTGVGIIFTYIRSPNARSARPS